MRIIYNKREFVAHDEEFPLYIHPEYNNLRNYRNLGKLEKEAAFLNEIADLVRGSGSVPVFVDIHPTHGGLVGMLCAEHFARVVLVECADEHRGHIEQNMAHLDNVEHLSMEEVKAQPGECLVFRVVSPVSNPLFSKIPMGVLSTSFLWSSAQLSLLTDLQDQYFFWNQSHWVFVPKLKRAVFLEALRHFVREDTRTIQYENLIHYTMIVKNAGSSFRSVLTDNRPFIDRWTILDTGSTDGTQDIIREVLGDLPGELHEEPFINFRESRNRCLDLAGTRCKFIMMLDDTYIIRGNIRKFLEDVRDDVYATSFSFHIKSHDVEYTSNRIFKAASGLRYMFTIHEVLQQKDNTNVIIPFEAASIYDYKDDYMDQRTFDRKQLDLKLLYQMVEEEPDNPRHLYYLAQTYKLLGDLEKTEEFYRKRIEHPEEGFLQEKIDATFELARLCHFQLKRPWPECEALYLQSYEMDKTRPDAIYFIGTYHYLNNNKKEAYRFFKKAFEIGYPIHAQYSLKPTLSFYFCPKLLAELCYLEDDFKTGEACTRLFLAKNPSTDEAFDMMNSWCKIFINLNDLYAIPAPQEVIVPERRLLVIIADGGFGDWTGRDILTKGMGGSETHVIEMARNLRQCGDFEVIVFCKAPEEDLFDGVRFIPISQCFRFLREHHVHTCVVSRYAEYVAVAIHANVENIHVFVHDLTTIGVVIPIHHKLKNIFCLTEWHVSFFNQHFPSLSHLTRPLYYGVDTKRFSADSQTEKVPLRFIYSSFPDRGLLPLLQMWPKIVERYPTAELHVFVDLNGKWVNDVAPEAIKTIKAMLPLSPNTVSHGWVSKAELAEAWRKADFWLYPCIFKETFCLTALEAAISKTVAVVSDLAALQNTVGDRGVMIPGDPMTSEWQQLAIEAIVDLIQNPEKKEALIRKNFDWASQLTWEKQARRLMTEYLDTPETNPMPPLPPKIQHLDVADDLVACLTRQSTTSEINTVLSIGIGMGATEGLLRALPRSQFICLEESHPTEKSTHQKDAKQVLTRTGPYLDNLISMVKKWEYCNVIIFSGKEMNNAFDFYGCLTVAWAVLRKGGLLALLPFKELPFVLHLALEQFIRDKKTRLRKENIFILEKE